MNFRLIQILSFALAVSFTLTTARADEPEPRFLRVVEEPAKLISLEISTLDMVPADDESGPRIRLVGVAHIGDTAFFAEVQKLLDEYELVLFEAVQPLDTRRSNDDPETRVRHTREAMRFVASAIEVYKEKHEHYPDNLEELTAFVSSAAPIVSNWLKRALIDAWGQPLNYKREEENHTYTLSSTGGDEELQFTAQATSPALDLEQDNLQQQLADALGLKFQLRSLRYDAPNWRPSDMTVNELNAALARHDVDFSVIGGTLAGTSFPAKLIGGLLRLVAVFDAMAQGAVSDMMKVMMIEVLGNESVLKMSMGQMGEGFATVIIDERNQVVVDDLASILRDEPHITSIAVLYGAAHLPDLAERLETQLGYVADETRWLPAISVDLTTSQMNPKQVQQMRFTVQRMLRQQMPR